MAKWHGFGRCKTRLAKDKINGFFDEITKETWNQMRQHSEEKIPVEVILFDFDGKVLSKYGKE